MRNNFNGSSRELLLQYKQMLGSVANTYIRKSSLRDGLSANVNLFGEYHHYHDEEADAIADSEAILSDFCAVGYDITDAMIRYSDGAG